MEQHVLVPDIGGVADVEIVEVLVKPGDVIEQEQSLITLESDKAAMEIPAPHAGTIKSLNVSVGDKVSEGSSILILDIEEAAETESTQQDSVAVEADELVAQALLESEAEVEVEAESEIKSELPAIIALPVESKQLAESQLSTDLRVPAHASPSVRRFARELGADLTHISGSGRKGRIVHEDVKAFIKTSLQQPKSALPNFADQPEFDFSTFGEIEAKPLSKIQRLSGAHLHSCWVSIPHVTQHGEADISELEVFRKKLNAELEPQGIKLTVLPLIMKAVVAALQKFPSFNASLNRVGDELILKKYLHIGVAVDTPDGLVVPVIRDADQKGLAELAKELADLGQRARNKKLKPSDMQGGSFTISSLGGIGGTGFTPIINHPEVAILGVSRADTRPVLVDGEFVPRLILPLSLSYDHRVIDGAAAARFIVYLGQVLSDLRRALV